ncbi:MAG: hypothetical protein NTW87_11930, partial [Planctomycetota bacterium]|nr:hypothetical protein [Planctomycetota bacterium]
MPRPQYENGGFDLLSHAIYDCEYLSLCAKALLIHYLMAAGQDDYTWVSNDALTKRLRIERNSIAKYNQELIANGLLYIMPITHHGRNCQTMKFLNYEHPLLKGKLDDGEHRRDQLAEWGGPSANIITAAKAKYAKWAGTTPAKVVLRDPDAVGPGQQRTTGRRWPLHTAHLPTASGPTPLAPAYSAGANGAPTNGAPANGAGANGTQNQEYPKPAEPKTKEDPKPPGHTREPRGAVEEGEETQPTQP